MRVEAKSRGVRRAQWDGISASFVKKVPGDWGLSRDKRGQDPRPCEGIGHRMGVRESQGCV